MATIPESRTKGEIAKLILSHELVHGKFDVETDLQKFFLKNNFMAPIRKEHLTLGLNNEPCVIKILPHFIKKHSRGKGDFVIAAPGLYFCLYQKRFIILSENQTLKQCFMSSMLNGQVLLMLVLQ